MASLIDFTTPFKGGPSYFTGTSSASTLVPFVFPIGIDGHAYAVDTAGQMVRAFEERLRPSTDMGAIPGEATINPQGLWRRGQTSWHLGAGQKYPDLTTNGNSDRFYSSKGVDPWTEGEVALLPATSQALSSANTNLPMCVAGGRVYVGDGNTLKYSSNLSSWTSVTTGAPASAAINALTTDGTTVFIAYAANDIYSHATSGSSVARYYPSSGSDTYTVLEYCKGWLIGCHENDIHLPTSGGTKSVFYAHPNQSFVWVGVASGQNAVYAAGYAGDVSLIYKMTLKADATGFDDPIVAGELPTGEQIVSIHAYLGFIVLGTERGVRFCTADGDNNLIIGPVIETTTSVKAGVGYGRFFWYGWTQFDATSTGLGRLDFGQFVDQNRPAYASDLMVTSQGAVNDVIIFQDKPVFSVSGAGVYKQSTDKVETATLNTGVWGYSIHDPKFLAFADLTTQPLVGTVEICRSFDFGDCIPIGTALKAGTTDATLEGPSQSWRTMEIELNFTRSASDATKGPVLTRWQTRAMPAVRRSELFQIPLLLRERVSINGRDFYFDVADELAFLRTLVTDARIVQLQVGEETFKAVMENLEWQVDDIGGYPAEFEGTAVVTMRSLGS